jgi:hypothetical protein
MNEEQIYALEIDGQFFPDDEPMWVHGTSGEIFEQVANQWGIEDEQVEGEETDFGPDVLYPSVRAIRAHQMLEDRIGKSGVFKDPDSLLLAMIREGFARRLTDSEFDSWVESEQMEEYEEARGELDDEWVDGVWET